MDTKWVGGINGGGVEEWTSMIQSCAVWQMDMSLTEMGKKGEEQEWGKEAECVRRGSLDGLWNIQVEMPTEQVWSSGMFEALQP